MKGFGSPEKKKKKKIKNLDRIQFKEQIIYQAFKSHSEGNIAEAMRYYQSFIKEGFKDFRVFSNYGFILIGLGKLKEAELSYRKAIALKPDDADAYVNLGNILKELSKFREAEKSLRKAIVLKPDFAEAYLNLGKIMRILGKLREAKLCSEKIMSIRSWSILGSYSFNSEMKLD